MLTFSVAVVVLREISMSCHGFLLHRDPEMIVDLRVSRLVTLTLCNNIKLYNTTKLDIGLRSHNPTRYLPALSEIL
jgi:hypothetical protein